MEEPSAPAAADPREVSWARAHAPVRVLDAGGWTDTWFAGRGLVCHLCVGPGVEVLVERSPSRSAGRPVARLCVPDYDEDYSFEAGAPPGRHPLLEATLKRWAPPGCDLDVTVSSSVPPGSSLGTSASVVVALGKTLRAVALDPVGPHELARGAHEVETIELGRQSGVQDQVAAAFGGANLLRVGPFPAFEVTRLRVSPATLEDLSSRLVTVYLGGHDSSSVHAQVISRLEAGSTAGHHALGTLRGTASRAASALEEGDITAYARAMVDATDAQALLHPGIINQEARRALQIAEALGAAGWKVNGAGGPGGSVTVVSTDAGQRASIEQALQEEVGARLLALRPCSEGATILACG